MSVPDLFLLVAGIIVLGWLGQVFFERTRIPDVLLLIGLGIVLGPVLGFLPAGPLRQVAPHVGTLALIIILFEGGLRLNLRDLLHQFGPAFVLTLLAFGLGCAALAAFSHAVLLLSWPQSLLLGAILSGAPSGVIALPVVSRLSVPEGTKTVVSLESGLSDIFSIVTVVLLLGYLSTGGEGASVAWQLGMTFGLAFATALLVGLGWLAALNLFRGHSLSYMLTLAVLFTSYALTEKLGGSGALAVLLTGAVVSNAENAFEGIERRWRRLSSAWGLPEGSPLAEAFEFRRHFANIEPELLRFNSEVSFLVRTFFFVFLGAVAQMPGSGMELSVLALAFCAALLARALAAGAFVGLFKSQRPSFMAYLVMAPRGLAAAVLAYMPTASGIAGAEGFPAIAFGFILLSNLVLTLGVPLVERSIRAQGPAPAPEA